LAQAISSTRPTAPRIRNSVSLESPTISSRSDFASAPTLSFESGYCFSRRAAMTFRSASAAVIETLGFILPMALAQWLPRPPYSLLSITCGTQSCDSIRKRKPAGITPMIVYFRAFNSIGLPTTAGSPEKWLLQKP
jgi:hypothetical protein